MPTKHNVEKLYKPRKINLRYDPEIMQWNWLTIKAKEEEAIEQPPTFTQPATASVIFT